MKTKIVYIACTDEKHNYYEQCVASAWTARFFNPSSHIVLVCDTDTLDIIVKKKYNYRELFDEVISKEFNTSVSIKERSRSLKTSLRNIIEGDFLFIDSDTFICEDLSFIDEFEQELGMVPDNNIELKKHRCFKYLCDVIRTIYNIDISNEQNYFNSGVIYAKDTIRNHEFFKEWHKEWNEYRNNELINYRDQFSLNKVDICKNHHISELPGNLNAQILCNIKYYKSASILHYYNTWSNNKELYPDFPFIGSRLYNKISTEGLTNEIKNVLMNFRFHFTPYYTEFWYKGYSIIEQSNYELNRYTHSYIALDYIQKHMRFLFKLLEVISKTLRRVYSYFKKNRKKTKGTLS